MSFGHPTEQIIQNRMHEPETFVKFTVECNRTKPGQVIKLTGSSPRLGNWNPRYGFTMHTNANEFP